MRKIFESYQQEKVGLFQSILEGAGMLTLIKNDCTAAAEGTHLLDPNLPQLWVMNDEDYDQAIEMLRPHYESMVSTPLKED
ncbi:DUF2007 domain-containing protein [Akkermansiaceae bacterium]|nr:DUF2007 domain-containing protein [Akkermansiaceae bacterium]MDB4323644.1 DUF2007 domain-containing protein [Akkermansiaceae bacterium]